MSNLYLTLDEVLEMHSILIKQFGGAQGVRDLGLLESALYRPQTGYYHSLFEMAAALFELLMNNHPFVDVGSNKRMAFFATDVFLRKNGYKFVVEATILHGFLMDLFITDACDMEYLHS